MSLLIQNVRNWYDKHDKAELFSPSSQIQWELTQETTKWIHKTSQLSFLNINEIKWKTNGDFRQLISCFSVFFKHSHKTHLL